MILENIINSVHVLSFSGCLGDSSLPVSNIVRVIVAGNSVSKETQGGDWAMGPKFRQKKTNQGLHLLTRALAMCK